MRHGLGPKILLFIVFSKESPAKTQVNFRAKTQVDILNLIRPQGLAAQARPVVVKPTKAASAKTPEKSQAEASPSESTKVYTLYFSGRSPGEYTTRLTTVTVGEGSSESPSRRKRQAEEESIEPTRVRPILMTEPPSHKQACGKCWTNCNCRVPCPIKLQ